MLRNRGRLALLQLCEEEDGARPHYSGHRWWLLCGFLPIVQEGRFEEGRHRLLQCMPVRSDCSLKAPSGCETGWGSPSGLQGEE